MRKNISFGKISVVELEEESEEEAKKSWYSSGDLQKMRKKEDKKNTALPFHDTSLREQRRNYLVSMLSLQLEQQELGVKDDKGLQMMSRTLTKNSVKNAQLRASIDSVAVFHLFNDACPQYMVAKSAKEFSKSTLRRRSKSSNSAVNKENR